jgi:hypothetical protein
LLDATVQLRFPTQSKKHFGREEDRRDEDLEKGCRGARVCAANIED